MLPLTVMGGDSGRVPETSDLEISTDIPGKEKDKEKRENGAEKKENWEREDRKMKMEWRKVTK